MDSLCVEYSYENRESKTILMCKIRDESLKGLNSAYLMSDILEGALYSSTISVCYDLSSIEFMNSSSLGVLINLASKADELDKIIRFRMSESLSDIVKSAGMEDIIRTCEW